MMLVRGGDKAARAREIGEARQTRLAAEPIDEFCEARVADSRDHLDMEPAVGVQVVDDVTAARALGDLVGDVGELAQVLRTKPCRRPGDGGYLEQQSDLGDLVKIGFGHLKDTET